MQRFIVTGGLGFIGSNLIELLLSKKFKVLNIDRVNYASNTYNVKDFFKNKNYSFVKANINDQNKILSILNKFKPHGIFNLAAETHVDRSIDGPKNFIQSNIVGTFNLLECFKDYSKKYKSKLVHISTDEVYGDILSGRSSEIYPYKPSSPYAASKAASDHLVYSYVRTYNLPAIITNCSNNYGPKQHDEKLIPTIIRNALQGNPIPIYGDGKNIRDWLYVLDHCKGIDLVYHKGEKGQTYNIGGRNERTNLQIVDRICAILDERLPKAKSYKDQVTFVQDRAGHDRRYAIDATKLEHELGWQADENFDTDTNLDLNVVSKRDGISFKK